MKKEKIKLFYCAVFMSLMKPYIFNEFYYVDFVLNLIKVVIVLYLFFVWLFREKKGNNYTYLSFAFVSIIIFSTIINSGSVINALSASLPIMGIVLFLDVYINDLKSVISSFQRMIELFVIINLMSIIVIGVHVDELTLYFLGSKNGLTIIVPLYILVTSVYSSIFPRKRNRSAVVYIILFLSIIITKSTTMIVEIVVFFALYILQYHRWFRGFLNYWFFLGVYAVINVVLLFSPYIGTLLEFLDAYLNKGGDSMKIRIQMWLRALEIIPNHLLFGIGKWTEKQWNQWFYGFNYKAQLHNEIIEFMTLGGFVLLFVYISICIVVGRKMMCYNLEKITIILTIGCFLAYISVLTSAIYNAEFFMIFGLGYYVKNIIAVVNSHKINNSNN